MNTPVNAVIRLRRELHRYPEISGHETETARRILKFFKTLHPDTVIKGLGGTGLAFVFTGLRPGPTVMLRSEMDALPIQEAGSSPCPSTIKGRSHACGHDGHMAILAAVGLTLAANRPATGRAVLLFQPAEENGQGAAAVIRDERFASIRPDLAFALHNLPGFPLGMLVVKAGAFNCASRGMVVELRGRTAHAAQPETGRSPARAMGRMIVALGSLQGTPQSNDESTFATVVGARLGRDDAFGTAPGKAEIRATLRSASNEGMQQMVTAAEKTVTAFASEDGLEWDIRYRDIFPVTVNSPRAVETVLQAARKGSVQIVERPFRWSEDFGRFTQLTEGALVGIGAGEKWPALHNPEYVFPEALIGPASSVLKNILTACLH